MIAGDHRDLLPGLSVSRETSEMLEYYLSQVIRWNRTVNLISKSTVEDAWRRHIVDSAQLYTFANSTVESWADFGSGAGFPGIVIAILSREKQKTSRITLVESDKRKAAFLRDAARKLDLNIAVVDNRIEQLDSIHADVVSARALAPLCSLLTYAHRHLKADGTCLFLKGETYRDEVELARESWDFDLTIIPSVTDASGVVLKIQGLSNA